MNVAEFRLKIKPDVKLLINGKEYRVKEVVKFQFDDGSIYVKCFLNNGYVFADDLDGNSFILVKETKTDFHLPFPEKLNFDGKEFEFLYSAHAIAEEIKGEEIFKLGDSEKFWDYKANDDSYLSLGINDKTGERVDDYGRIINPFEIEIRE